MSDADRPADVRNLITDDVVAVYHRWKGRPHSIACLSCRDELATLFADLSAAGLAVVPAGEQREEFGLQRNYGDVGSVMTGDPYYSRKGAEATRRMPVWSLPPTLVRREVHFGPWLPVEPDATPAAGTSGAPSPG